MFTSKIKLHIFNENKYPEKVFVRDIAIEADVLGKINKAWEAHWNIEDRESTDEEKMLEKPLEDRYRKDLQRCQEFNILIPTELMTDYHAKKIFIISMLEHTDCISSEIMIHSN